MNGFWDKEASSRAQASLHNQDVVGSNQSDHSRFVIKIYKSAKNVANAKVAWNVPFTVWYNIF